MGDVEDEVVETWTIDIWWGRDYYERIANVVRYERGEHVLSLETASGDDIRFNNRSWHKIEITRTRS